MSDQPMSSDPETPRPDDPLCAGCGGPYRFDTSIPSVVWNAVVRSLGGPEFLCLNCILPLFVKAGVSFTATLSGADLHGVPVEVQINNAIAQDATKIQDENNDLRHELAALQQQLTALELENADLRRSEHCEIQLAIDRAESAEQQLTAARNELDAPVYDPENPLDALKLNSYGRQCYRSGEASARAQVIAQVKALIDTDFLHVEILDGAVDSAMALLKIQLDALQPDPSLAVLSEADREQVMRMIAYLVPSDQNIMAEARRLLHLPQEPTR